MRESVRRIVVNVFISFLLTSSSDAAAKAIVGISGVVDFHGIVVKVAGVCRRCLRRLVSHISIVFF